MYRDSTEGERACWRFDQKHILIGNPKFVIGSTTTTVMCGCHDSRHTTEEGFAQIAFTCVCLLCFCVLVVHIFKFRYADTRFV